jgi:diaminohydroxyphosphoribosylaminopyrimidine deaminase/5-amino-6-(5-phosphoribosylamino)uracil reductase
MSGEGRTLFVVRKGVDKVFTGLCEKYGKEFLEFGEGMFDLKALTGYLGSFKTIESILIEGGGRVYYNALKEKIVDKIIVFIAPKILGGAGMPFFNGITGTPIAEALKVRDFYTENIGDDIMIQGYL